MHTYESVIFTKCNRNFFLGNMHRISCLNCNSWVGILCFQNSSLATLKEREGGKKSRGLFSPQGQEASWKPLHRDSALSSPWPARVPVYMWCSCFCLISSHSPFVVLHHLHEQFYAIPSFPKVMLLVQHMWV